MAQPAPPPVYLTVEEFETYDVPDDMRAELVRGELRLIPPPGFGQGVLVTRIIVRLSTFVEAKRLGVVTTSSGYELAGLPRTVRAPDIAFVSATRLSRPSAPTRIARMRPDLTVEIRSPSETKARLREKLDDYRAAGVPLVWVIDLERRSVMIVEENAPARWISEAEILDGGGVLPGFSCRVSELFEGLD